MNCFVASAFDHDDVDAIYDSAIRPVLSEFKLRPLRVDRVEHNDDIDDQIFALIDRSQICIADLTHARPSVYYEAGYAFGQDKPVIYLARSDHFRHQKDDPADNLRVHFDLQMKNIIPWTKPNDTFKRRLRSRLKHVLRPILRAQKLASTKRVHELQFANLSQIERLQAMADKARRLLRPRGYSAKSDGTPAPHGPLEKILRGTYRKVHILPVAAVVRKNTEYLWLLHDLRLTPKESARVKKTECIVIFAALRVVRPTTLSALLPSWTPVSDRVFRRTASAIDGIPHSDIVAVIDAVKSLQDFTERFRQLITELDL